MIILGVDPGLKATGYGVIEARDKQERGIRMLEAGIIAPRPRESMPNKIAVLYKNLGDIIDQYGPAVMVLEKLYAHDAHPTTACILGHARGVISLLAAQKNLIFVEHSVKRIRKAILGNGNATKEQTRASVAHLFKIDAGQLTLDASDALALALGYVYMEQLSLPAGGLLTGARG